MDGTYAYKNVTQPFFYYPINETYVYGGSLTLNTRIPKRIKLAMDVKL